MEDKEREYEEARDELFRAAEKLQKVVVGEVGLDLRFSLDLDSNIVREMQADGTPPEVINNEKARIAEQINKRLAGTGFHLVAD